MSYRTRAEADRVLQKNFGERYKRLDALERVADGRQYEGRPGFWEPNIPLFDKAPIIRSRIVSDAISDNTSLLLGEGRFPEVTSRTGEDTSRDDESAATDDGLTPDESQRLDDLIAQAARQMRWRAHERQKYAAGQTCGTAVGMLGVRHRKLFADVTLAKWATPEWRDQDTAEGHADGELERLTVSYPYLEEVKVRGEKRYNVLVYRRVIDRARDVTFVPVEAPEDGREIDAGAWKEDPSKTLQHGLGFVPAVWWRFGRNTGAAVGTDGLDGRAIHAGIDIEPFDMALSQRHRSALYLQPQIVELGVQIGYNPTEPAQEPTYYDTPGQEKQRYRIRMAGETGGRKQGPGFTWQYPDGPKDMDVRMLESSGESLRAISEHAADLEIKLAQSLAVVFLDPTRIRAAGQLSGRALRMLKLRQIDRVSEHHDEWTEESAQPTLSMACRIALLKRDELDLPGLKPALPILARFAQGGTWTFPQLSFVRGPWFDLDPEEETATIATAAMALEKGLASEVQAIRKAQPVMGGEDPTDTLDAIKAEKAERQAQAMAVAQSNIRAEADAFHARAKAGLTDDKPDKPRTPAGRKGPRLGPRESAD